MDDSVSYAVAALQLIPSMIALGEDVVPFAVETAAVLSSGGDPTPAQWDTLHAAEDALRARLNASGSGPGPLPAA